MEIRRYIVGVDGSLPSRAAIRWAIGHARQNGTEVLLTHVADDEWGSVGSELIDEVDSGARRLLDDEVAYARSLEGTDGLRAQLRRGSPMAVLASLGDADTMLVVGTHKTGFHYGRAFGSRSLQLANLAVGPVAIVPDTESRLRRGVVVGVDDSTAGTAALDLAADLACDHHCELIAVRSSGSWPTGAERRELGAEVLAQDDEDARRLLAAAVERVRRRQEGITIRSRVVRRPPGTALNDIARSAEVLVVGDSRRDQVQPGGLGSVAYDVLLNVSSPTIVVHAPSVTAAHDAEGEAHVAR